MITNDIVITYKEKEGSEEKLRQILRIIENEFQGYNEIVIAGDTPEWVQGTINIRYRFNYDRKWEMKNKLNMLQLVCEHENVSTRFVWVDQDDILFKLDANKPCRIQSNISPVSHSKITLKHTEDILNRRGFKVEDYFAPYPMSFDKISLMKTFDLIDFETMYGYDIKTLYANFNRLKDAPQTEPLCYDCYEVKSSYEKY